MEKVIENAIDNKLQSLSSELYFFSVGVGIVLVITGIVLILSSRKKKEKNCRGYGGIICLFLGVVAIISGFIQI
ncbi:hypothetical protein [Enterococcus sp. AZ072]|uniref:hypothetical protein n=1 Tax=unclassified Enterococcus TaxID=2608891 RepID=UPI003D2D27CE